MGSAAPTSLTQTSSWKGQDTNSKAKVSQQMLSDLARVNSTRRKAPVKMDDSTNESAEA
ncbi:MAG: hypothetical protein KKB81_01780 [Candidatus Margulisbacteria bacterium]|nr:hypothetical protein [Candidatus Margulisiibacteriota bacterium]MBU1021646.1 hypothetical protein [Candidatus Margulisiibacteriota bacterium]MBU1728796.1 hypothetical protein [Candidatus Margulisiibacteriota bacterium]MBU1955762.1 hypothetical protein [Candidatus Margulisiibacteriota bacterium]